VVNKVTGRRSLVLGLWRWLWLWRWQLVLAAIAGGCRGNHNYSTTTGPINVKRET